MLLFSTEVCLEPHLVRHNLHTQKQPLPQCMKRVNAETHISVFRVQPNRERRYCVSWQSYDESLRLLSTPVAQPPECPISTPMECNYIKLKMLSQSNLSALYQDTTCLAEAQEGRFESLLQAQDQPAGLDGGPGR